MAWYIWAILGVLAIVFEVASPSFFAGFIGAGFFCSAILACFWSDSLIWQILIALVGMVLGAFMFKRQKIADISGSKLGQSDEFIGVRGKVESTLKEDIKGSVKLLSPVLGSTKWMAIAQNGVEIPIGATVEIISTHGTYLTVKEIS